MKLAAVVAILVLAAVLFACAKSAPQATGTTQTAQVDAGTSLESQFDSFDEPTSSMADVISDQDLATASS